MQYTVKNYEFFLPATPQFQWLKDYSQHLREQAEAESGWKIENIRFEHDPEWNTRFLSIQSAHDGSHPVWAAAHIFSNVAMPFFGFWV